MRSLLLLAIALAASGCCTEIGCTSGYTLVLGIEQDLAEGVYTLEVVEDGVAEAPCELVVAYGEEACEDFGGEFDGCIYAEADCPFHFVAETDARGGDFRAVGRFPTDIEATLVDEQGVVIAEATWQPTYRESRPNGPWCGHVCKSALVTLDVP